MTRNDRDSIQPGSTSRLLGMKGEQLPERPERDEGESRELEMLKQRLEKFDPRRREQAMEHKRHMGTFMARGYDPGVGVLRKLKVRDVGLFISDKNDKATVRPCKNPSPLGSFGFIGCFAEVTSESAFPTGCTIPPL